MKERILSFSQARVLNKDEVEAISGAGWSTTWTASPSLYGSLDGFLDVTIDC